MQFLAGTGMSDDDTLCARPSISSWPPSAGAQARRSPYRAEAGRAEAEHRAVADAQKIVAIWNARHVSGFYPTIGARSRPVD
jgi:hypothetical protein